MANDVFISYAREDERSARQLKDELVARGWSVWLDRDEILPGERWRTAIENALARASFVLVCLSSRSVGKRGFVQRELRIALDALQEVLDEDIYLVPVRLDACAVPGRLQHIQYIDLFEDDGVERIARALEVGLERRARAASAPAAPAARPLEAAVDLAALGGGRLIERLAGAARIGVRGG